MINQIDYTGFVIAVMLNQFKLEQGRRSMTQRFLATMIQQYDNRPTRPTQRPINQQRNAKAMVDAKVFHGDDGAVSKCVQVIQQRIQFSVRRDDHSDVPQLSV